jgi:hypothetical protein
MYTRSMVPNNCGVSAKLFQGTVSHSQLYHTLATNIKRNRNLRMHASRCNKMAMGYCVHKGCKCIYTDKSTA